LAVGALPLAWSISGDSDPAHPDDTILIDRNPDKPTQIRATVNGVIVGRRAESKVGLISIFGGNGNDTLTVSLPGNTRIRTILRGGEGNDTIQGSDGRDEIFGNSGNDTLNGGKGSDTIRGGKGDDSLVGGNGPDQLFGGAGSDVLRGGPGTNRLDGGDGHDQFFGVRELDTVALADDERLIGNESTNPLSLLDTFNRLKSWYIDTGLARWSNQLEKPAGSPWGWPILFDAAPVVALSTPLSQPGDFSGTNNQVAGVDEGDLVETDGRYLFVRAGDGVDILNAWPADTLSVVSHIAIAGQTQSLFLHGTRLTVISQENNYSPLADALVGAPVGIASGGVGWWNQTYQPLVHVSVIDVSDVAHPAILEKTSLDGWLIDARAIESRVLVITQDNVNIPTPAIIAVETVASLTAIPLTVINGPFVPAVDPMWIDGGPHPRSHSVYEDEAAYRNRLETAWNDAAESLPGFSVTLPNGAIQTGQLLTAGHTYLPLTSSLDNVLSVVSFDVDDDTAGPDTATSVAGVSGRVYASMSNLFIAAETTMGNWWDQTSTSQTTNIYQFDLNTADAPLTAMGAVPGTTLDQFSLDQSADGLLRVATTRGFGATASSGVFVLAATAGNLQSVGSVSGLALGERIFSVRFLGDRGYVSTFRQVDPLFVIDLANPSAPRVAGELKVPGFSSYLHPLDATHLLGIGRDADPDTGRFLGVQLSIFDVSDPANPRRTATYTFAGAQWDSWSAALYDHHAFSWFAEQGVLALPVQLSGSDNWNSDLVLLSIDVLSPSGFRNLGTIHHDTAIERSLRIGNFLYSVSVDQVKVHRLDDPTAQIAAVGLTPRSDDPLVYALL